MKWSYFNIKLYYELFASANYILNILLHVGKVTILNKEEHGDVLKKLLKRRLSKGHSLFFFDNFYTSVSLAKYLYHHKTEMTCIICPNCKGILGELKHGGFLLFFFLM